MFDYFVACYFFKQDYNLDNSAIKKYLERKYNYVPKSTDNLTDRQLAIYFGLENDHNLKTHGG